jgi:hypothetical protein
MAASVDDLGDVLSVHRGQPARRLGGIVAGAAMTIGMVWAIFEMKPPKLALCWLFALGFAAITCLFVVLAWRDASARLELRTRGVVFHRGGRVQPVAYDRIASAHVWTVNGKKSALLLALHDGREVRFPANLTDLDRVEATIGLRAATATLPTARVI